MDSWGHLPVRLSPGQTRKEPAGHPHPLLQGERSWTSEQNVSASQRSLSPKRQGDCWEVKSKT